MIAVNPNNNINHDFTALVRFGKKYRVWRCQEVKATIDAENGTWDGNSDPNSDPACCYIVEFLVTMKQRKTDLYHTRLEPN